MLQLVRARRGSTPSGDEDAEPGAAIDPRARLDEPTLEALRRGDRRVVQTALRALFPEVRSRMHRLLGPRDDLDDATQDALIEITRALPRFEGRASLSTLASRITVRTSFRYFGRPRTVPLEIVEPHDPDDPESRVASRETLRRLYRCLDKMSPKRRVAFVLCCVEGMTPGEAADIEGVPSLVMRARLLQARNEIARLMKGDPLAEALAQAGRRGAGARDEDEEGGG
ncbi:RNA polymerase sigma-54 factor RpoN [Sandaracinus amylolyticus]|uniref:RNA polymerase sigma-54 factor RpoN n=1 Tax=Sandaracinus amylolyticus TaxID=927083 RepID=A0A0F6WAK5_9BACT|nr:RNA polymerase sigma-54 factor RpoN [Sandaracinus amylolyticus]